MHRTYLHLFHKIGLLKMFIISAGILISTISIDFYISNSCLGDAALDMQLILVNNNLTRLYT